MTSRPTSQSRTSVGPAAFEVVLSPTGDVLAASPEARVFLAETDIRPLLSGEPASSGSDGLVADGYSVAVSAVQDHDNPCYIVRFTPVAKSQNAAIALTRRQLQVAQLAKLGYRIDDIARELRCAATTVRTHLRVVYERLSVSNRVELVRALDKR